ncbi:MAG TPA: tRNA (guanosine(46)-N7)-methyltransferase TrmB [Steroidobacter sp.]
MIEKSDSTTRTSESNNGSSEAGQRRRPVRSFVLRAGRTTAAQQRALVELWPTYGIEYSPQPLDLDAVFGRKATRMIEIGFGAGEALLTFAREHPQFDCLGIEVHRPGVGRLMLEAHAAQVQNLRIICHDAVEVLEHQIPPGSISVVHIFFPDPWPKKRHHKRRLIQPPFVELLARVMHESAVLRLATDWGPYAEHMREVLDASAKFENASRDGSGFIPRPEDRPLTKFERRGQRLGHDVWDLEYKRTRA